MLPRPTPHPCASETFGKRLVTVSLVTGNVYTDDRGEVTAEESVRAGLWVWRVLNANGFPCGLRRALRADH